MCLNHCGRHRRRPILITILHATGEVRIRRDEYRNERAREQERLSASNTEDFEQLLRRDNFELGIGTVARFFVGTPPSKVSDVAETTALHVVVYDFSDKFGAK